MDTITRASQAELEAFERWLSETYGLVNICGFYFQPAVALRIQDPEAYRALLADYLRYRNQFPLAS
jgi:hypothetical protein